MTDIKAGDRVRRTHTTRGGTHFSAGYEFTVASVRTGTVVEIDAMTGREHLHSSKYLERVIPLPPFKVGDRVRRTETLLGSQHPHRQIGYEFVVTEINDDESFLSVLDGEYWHSCSYLELVPPAKEVPSPVRTVTRKEVMPGLYGIVSVGEKGCVWVIPFLGAGDYIPQTAKQLREAAHILNQIAEAHEEEAKA